MKRKSYLLFMFLCLTIITIGQQKYSTFSDSLVSKFNYDTLRNFNCQQLPVGIYTLSFQLDKHLRPTNIRFSDDSLPILKSLLTLAINATLKVVPLIKNSDSYLLFIYYNNILDCYDPDTTEIPENKIDKFVMHVLSRSLNQTENSFKKSVPQQDKFIVLKPVVIRKDPKSEVHMRDFRNDHSVRKVTPEEEKAIIEKVKKAKEEKEKSKNE